MPWRTLCTARAKHLPTQTTASAAPYSAGNHCLDTPRGIRSVHFSIEEDTNPNCATQVKRRLLRANADVGAVQWELVSKRKPVAVVQYTNGAVVTTSSCLLIVSSRRTTTGGSSVQTRASAVSFLLSNGPLRPITACKNTFLDLQKPVRLHYVTINITNGTISESLYNVL